MEAQRRRPRLAVAVTAAMAGIAVAAGACGDDERPTGAEFAASANAVCADVVRASAALGRRRPEGVGEVVAVIDRLERELDRGARRLAALERPPGADGAAAAAFVSALTDELRTGQRPALRALRRAARARDAKALRRAVARLRGVDSTRSRAAARRIGATRCTG